MAKLIPSKQKVASTAENILRVGAGFGAIGTGAFIGGGQGLGGAIGSIIGAEVGAMVALKPNQSTERLIVRSIGILNAVDLLLDSAFNGRGIIG